MVQQTSLPQAQNDPALMQFLRETVNSFVRWDLIRFFNDNPHAMDLADNIARYIGRDLGPVEQELAGLVEAKVLRVERKGERRIYSLSPDATIRDLIARFVLACDDPTFRVNAIHQVIHHNTH